MRNAKKTSAWSSFNRSIMKFTISIPRELKFYLMKNWLPFQRLQAWGSHQAASGSAFCEMQAHGPRNEIDAHTIHGILRDALLQGQSKPRAARMKYKQTRHMEPMSSSAPASGSRPATASKSSTARVSIMLENMAHTPHLPGTSRSLCRVWACTIAAAAPQHRSVHSNGC